METTKHFVIVLILALLTTRAATPAESQISNTRTASCLVKVTANPGILPLNYETIDYLLGSSSVAGKAGREVLSLSLDQSFDLFSIEPLSRDSAVDVSQESSRRRRPADLGEEYGFEGYGIMEEMTEEVDSPRSRRSGAGIDGGLLGDVASLRSRRVRTDRSSGLDLYGGVDRRTSRLSGRERSRGIFGEETARVPRRTRGTIPAPPGLAVEQTILFRLSVELPEDVKPAAQEFMRALIDNLRNTLVEAYHTYGKELENLLRVTQTQRDQAQSQLAKSTELTKATEPAPEIEQYPANVAVYEQLEQIVDLSSLDAAMPFAEVIMKLKNAVDPPLQIQPNWKNLLEYTEIDQTTPAGMDPLTGVKLRKALEILLAGVSSDIEQVSYFVDEGVILIATKDTLPIKMVTVVYDIPALAYSTGSAGNLINSIQDTIEPDSWYDLSEMGEGTISLCLGNKLAILQTPGNHRKIQKFLQSVTTDIPFSVPEDIPAEILLDEKRQLIREKRILEMDIARLEARSIAIGEQISIVSTQMAIKVEDDPVTDELKRLLDIQIQQLENIKKSIEHNKLGKIDLASEEEKITKTRIELAHRAEEIKKLAGGDQLSRFNNELGNITIELAEKRAELKVILNQLRRTENQLTSIYDPQFAQMRLATEALKRAENRLNELNMRIAHFQLPTVTMFGAD